MTATRTPLHRAVDAASTVMNENARALAQASAHPTGLTRALELLLKTRGCVVFTGLGKSGLIASKLAATFASTGTPSLFGHAADALHGDAGMVIAGDVVVALSKSGETVEVLAFADLLKRRGVQVLAITGCDGHSSLCSIADVVIGARVAVSVIPGTSSRPPRRPSAS